MGVDRHSLGTTWERFVQDFIARVDTAWAEGSPSPWWIKPDGSKVTVLDLRLDVEIRSCLAKHFAEVAVLSEEMGLLRPHTDVGPLLAIIDPVDGTDSLIQNDDVWWVSVGLVDAGIPVTGVIYQPSSGRLHDANRPKVMASSEFIVGFSPDQLTSDESSSVRSRLNACGAALISTPHAVEKVAAVIEGRATATIYLPSQKSPSWHSWDIAACLSIAEANGVVIRTLAGTELLIDPAQPEHKVPWMCASDEATWESVRNALAN